MLIDSKKRINTSTFDNWNSRNRESIKLKNAVELAQYFNISIDNIANIKNTNTLNSKENELIKNYNKADKTTQEIVDKILNIKTKSNFKYSNLKEENKLA
jgi:hypothetical protein